MKLLVDDIYIRMEYDESKQLTAHKWKPETDNMSVEEYKKRAYMQTESLEEIKAPKWFIDTSELGFNLSPDTQEWVDTVIFPRIIAAGVKFIALIIHQDLIRQMSIEQLMEERNIVTANFEIQYFDDKQKALDWLLSS